MVSDLLDIANPELLAAIDHVSFPAAGCQIVLACLLTSFPACDIVHMASVTPLSRTRMRVGIAQRQTRHRSPSEAWIGWAFFTYGTMARVI